MRFERNRLQLAISYPRRPDRPPRSGGTEMSKLCVNCFTLSLDGFGAGPNQSLANPLGVGGEDLHQWMIPTRTFQKMTGKDKGTTGVSDDLTARGFENVGAWIMGRNMFGPVRGGWPDERWNGWW